MAASPTSRSMNLLRQRQYYPWVVETFNRFAQKRFDLWNFGDIIAIAAGEPHLIVQTTSYSGVSARVKKILAEPRALLWIKTGGRVVVHGWHKKPIKRGAKRMKWIAREVEVTAEMFSEQGK